MYKLYLLLILTGLSIITPPLIAEEGGHKCHVASVINGDTFKCKDGLLIRIWGIKAPSVPPRVSEAIAKSNGGLKAKEYLNSYILNETLTCYPKGLLEGGNVAQCFKDLQVKTIDIADPLLIGGHAVELKNVTKGYYTNPNRPKSH